MNAEYKILYQHFQNPSFNRRPERLSGLPIDTQPVRLASDTETWEHATYQTMALNNFPLIGSFLHFQKENLRHFGIEEPDHITTPGAHLPMRSGLECVESLTLQSMDVHTLPTISARKVGGGQCEDLLLLPHFIHCKVPHLCSPQIQSKKDSIYFTFQTEHTVDVCHSFWSSLPISETSHTFWRSFVLPNSVAGPKQASQMNSHKTLNLKLKMLAKVVTAIYRFQGEQWQGPKAVSCGPSQKCLCLCPDMSAVWFPWRPFRGVIWDITLYYMASI